MGGAPAFFYVAGAPTSCSEADVKHWLWCLAVTVQAARPAWGTCTGLAGADGVLPVQEPKYVIEAVLFGLLLLTGKWVTASLLLGVCAWDLRTYLRGEHKVRRQRVARQSVGASAARLGRLSSLFAG